MLFGLFYNLKSPLRWLCAWIIQFLSWRSFLHWSKMLKSIQRFGTLLIHVPISQSLRFQNLYWSRDLALSHRSKRCVHRAGMGSRPSTRLSDRRRCLIRNNNRNKYNGRFPWKSILYHEGVCKIMIILLTFTIRSSRLSMQCQLSSFLLK